MNKRLWLTAFWLCLAVGCWAQFSFYLIDNFEDGRLNAKWWRFGNLKMEVVRVPTTEASDLVAGSGGDYGLRLSGGATDWYVGGVGTDLNLDSSPYTRLQIDVRGISTDGGKLVIELFDDDNGNNVVELDPNKNFMPTRDDKWVAEMPLLGKGVTRTSIPFSAFRLANPGAGNGRWDPDQKNGSSGLLKLQLVAVAGKKDGQVDFIIDNLLMTD